MVRALRFAALLVAVHLAACSSDGGGALAVAPSSGGSTGEGGATAGGNAALCGTPEARCSASQDCWPWTCVCGDGSKVIARQCGGDRYCSDGPSTCATQCDFHAGFDHAEAYGSGPTQCSADENCPAWSCNCKDGTTHETRRCEGQCCGTGEAACDVACQTGGGTDSVSGPTAPPITPAGGGGAQNGGGGGSTSVGGGPGTAGNGGNFAACNSTCATRFPCPPTPAERCLYCQAACACQCAGDSACAAANNSAACSLNGCCF